MTKFSNKFKNPIFGQFWVPFSQLLGGMDFLENLDLSCTTSNVLLAPCQNVGKINDTVSRKPLDRWKNRLKDGRTEGRTDAIL